MPADNAAEVAPAQTTATNQPTANQTGEADGAAQPAAGQTDHPGESTLAERLMDHLGIEGEERDVVVSQKTASGAEPTARSEDGGRKTEDGESEDGDQKTEDGSQKTEDQEDEEAEEEEEKPTEEEEPKGKTEWPKDAIAIKDKYRRQRNEARDEAKALQDENEQLRSQLENLPAPQVMPTPADPLANVADLKALAQTQQTFRFIREQCTLNPDGWTVDEGQPSERFVSPEMVRKALVEAQTALDAVPQKAEALMAKPKFDEEARRILPAMFDRGTADFQAAQNVVRDMPWLVADPQHNLKVAVFLRGWQTVQSEMNAAAGNGTKTNGNGKQSLKDALPPELVEQHRNRGKVPYLKQSPPGRPSGSAAPNGGKAVNEAMQAVIDGEDGAEGIGRAFAAMRSASDAKPGPRSPVTV